MENNFRNKDSVFTLCILQMENNFENRESVNTLIILKMENNFENEESVSTHSIHMYWESVLALSILQKESDFKTPFCTLSSGTRYSFINPGKTVNGEQVSATMAMATVVQTRFCLSWTFKLFNNVASTSWGPIAFAI